MKRRIASLTLTLTLGIWLFSIPAVASEACPDASRAASKLAQDYRNAVGKVRIACNKSSEECVQHRIEADHILNLLIPANQAMLAVCVFTDSPGSDDSLPVTAATVAAAIDSTPESILVGCGVVGEGTVSVELGCPNGWLLNIPISNLSISGIDPTAFSYSLNLDVSGSIPVNYNIASVSGSCTVTLNTPAPGILVTGTATFSSSSDIGTPLNRLELVSDPISLQSLQSSGCGVISPLLPGLITIVSDAVESTITSILSPNFCGAAGAELFGPCP